MSETNLSKAVADATSFLWEIHTDVRAMLVSFEAALERAGWAPLTKKLGGDLKSTLQGEWLLWWCYRFYAPKSDSDTLDRLVVVVCDLGRDDGANHDYATMTVAAVRFSRPTTFAEVYGLWNSTLLVTRAALGRGGVVALTPVEFAEFSPHAFAVAALALPLCALNSEEALVKQVVEPILAAEKELGAQP